MSTLIPTSLSSVPQFTTATGTSTAATDAARSSTSTSAEISTTTSPSSTTTSTTTSTSSSTESAPSSTISSSTTSTTSSPSTTSSSSTSSSTSSSSTSLTSPPATTSSPTSSLTLTETSNGQTATVIVTASESGASASQSAVSDSTSGGKSFFQNKGAVAGVFTVVGLVALVLFVVLATNAIRRRRAKKFDEEVAAAAAEANASPHYPFDDYDDPAPGAGYGMGAYSDPESHGTLSQVPLTHSGESYNMSEFNGGYNPSYGAGTASVGTGVSAGAAGIGASRSLARRGTNPNANYADPVGAGVAGFGANQSAVRAAPGQTTPYNAFGGPLGGIPSDPYDPYTAGNIGIKRQGSRNGGDLLDAAGVGAAGAGAAAALNRGPSQNTTQSLNRKQSQGTQRTFSPDNSNGNGNGTSNGTSGGTTQESYAAHYQPDFRPDAHQYQPPPAAAPASAGDGLPNPFARDGTSDEDAYGAESYFPAGRLSLSQEESRMSIRDEEDYGRAGRTLKVANE